MKEVNCIIICKDDYKSEQDWKQAIADAVMLLLNANYIMTVKYDEKGLGIVSIEYDYNCPSMGGPFPYWLLPEEFDMIEVKE